MPEVATFMAGRSGRILRLSFTLVSGSRISQQGCHC